MTLTNSLVNRLREVLLSGTWVTGTNYKNEIITLDWKDAITVIHDLNCVAKLTFHIHYYISGVTQVLEGGPLEIRDKYSFDAPDILKEEDWKALTSTFCKDAERFIQLIEQLSEEDLKKPFVKEQYGDYARNIELMIEHCYYHLGQIILIKKLIQQRSE